GWHNWLAKAYQLMPADAKLVQVRYPRPPRKGSKAVGEIYEFRFSSADNWFGLATSHVKINAIGGTITEVSRFETRSWSEKLYTVLVPLHTGRQLHWSYVLVLLLFSLLGTVMVVSGVVSFLQKNRKRKAKIKRQPKAVESDTSPSTPVQACIESK
ncbi:MAG: PepSY domain-containing protein, partial [Pseudomonadales bacterium]|nr:PepSY domain-containing protein [Pseudomonadales bacterium]